MRIQRHHALGLAAVALSLLALIFWVSSGGSKTFKVDGYMDDRVLSELRLQDIKEIEEIVINSPGGDYDAAIEIAEIIQDNKIDLVIDGYCLSSCASIVLASDPNPKIISGSLIGFHNLIGLWPYLRKYFEEREGMSVRNFKVFETSNRVLSLYQNSGLNPKVFLAISARQGLKCYNAEWDSGGDRIEKLSFELASDIYFPSTKLLSQFGWEFSGSWSNTKDPERIERKFLRDFPETTFIIEEANFEVPEQFRHNDIQLSSLPICE